MSFNDQTRDIKETLGRGSNDNANVFEVHMSTPPCTFDINLRICVLNPHKLHVRQSQIVTNQKTPTSQYVILS